MKRHIFLVVIPVAMLCACGGKSSVAASIEGYYRIERTCVTTEPVARTATLPGLHQDGGHSYTYGLTLSTATRAGTVRVATDDGCSFTADVDATGVVAAKDVDCDPLAQDSPLWVSGFSAAKVLTFSFASKDGVSREFTSADIRGIGIATQPDVPSKNYAICEGHLAKPVVEKGTFLVKHRGEYKCSAKQPDAIQQAAAPGCTDLVGSGTTSGTLFVRFGDAKNELVVYEEGAGCTVHANSSDGVVFNADGSTCELGQFGLSLLGVTERRYDSYRIDLGNKTWTYSSRDKTTVMDIPQCLQATANLSGDLPR